MTNKYVVMGCCSDNSSIALTNEGKIFSWGKGNVQNKN